MNQSVHGIFQGFVAVAPMYLAEIYDTSRADIPVPWEGDWWFIGVITPFIEVITVISYNLPQLPMIFSHLYGPHFTPFTVYYVLYGAHFDWLPWVNWTREVWNTATREISTFKWWGGRWGTSWTVDVHWKPSLDVPALKLGSLVRTWLITFL